MRGVVLTTADSLRLWLAASPATSQPSWVVSYLLVDSTTTLGSVSGVFTGTSPLTALAAPTSGKIVVTRIDVFNGDTNPCRVFGGKLTSSSTTTFVSRPISAQDSSELLTLPAYTPQGDMLKSEYDADGDGIIDAAIPVAHSSSHASGGVDEVTPAAIGLGNVDNTSDASKPVSAAQATAITAQVFAEVALTNPYSATTPIAPRYIGDVAVNSTTLEVWQAQASAAAATSWSCVSRGFYNGVVLTDTHAFNSNGWFSALSTASNMPAAENCLFSQKNSNLGTTSAFLMGVGLTSFKLYFQQKSASTWGAWSTGVTAAEIGCLSGVTSAIQTQLNAKAALVDGKVPDSQLSTKALRSRVQGDVCVATFGDSTAQAVFTSGVTDMGNYVVAFPESGATTVNTGRYFTVGGLGRYRLVGDGGIPGTEVVSFLNRSKSAYSATRRALPDIIATRPDVVLWHGGSVNNITALTSYSSGVVASMIDFHCRGVKILTEAGIDVIDSGILGISIDDAYAGVRRQTLLEVNAGLAALAAEDPLWHWLEPNGLMHDGTGAFYSDYCDPDGVHPNYLGCYILGLAESEIIESLFYASLPSAVRYDFQPDFANASATVPAKMLRSFSTATINSTVCHEDLYTVNLTTSGSTLIQLTLGYADIKGSVLLGASSGSRFLMHTRAWVENSDGSLLAGVYGLASATFTDATNAKSVTWVNRTYNSGRDLVTKFALPCDAADLGTGSYFLLMSLTIPSAGTYNFKMTPPRIFSE